VQRSHLLAAASRPAEGGGVARAAPRPPRQARKTRPDRLVSGIVGLCQRSGEKGGEETGPNPVDRGRPGSKRHLLVDGLPLSVILTGANVHDSRVFEELIEGVEPIRTPSGLPRRRPDKIHADKGYDFPRCRSVLRQRGIKERIARRGVDSSERLGRHRWVVKRPLAWLSCCRRLCVRYERRADIHGAFLELGCALVCFNRLRRKF
jgi:transposase